MNPALKFASGPLAAATAFCLCRLAGLEDAAAFTAAITVWTALWWLLEPVALGFTSLLPLVLFPLTGVLTHERLAGAVGNKMILLLLGSFMMSTAIEKTGAHRRLALGMITAIGGHSYRRVVLGFMIAAALLSAWISNTATTLMLLPVALAVIQQDKSGALGVPLLLGLAYAASIGGFATPIGTPPNPIFLGAYSEFLKDPSNAGLVAASGAHSITFAGWMLHAVPITAALLPLACWSLTRKLPREGRIDLDHPGPWRPAERRVLAVFGLVITAWITLAFPYGGWSRWLGLPGVWDSDVALAAVILLALVPDGEGGRLLDWRSAVRIPWDLLLLIAAGIAISYAFESSGLSTHLVGALRRFAELPFPVVLLAIVTLTCAITEVMNNTPVAALMMPILTALSVDLGRDPYHFMLAATLAASCAFMLPIATAPNAVVFSTGHITLSRMAMEGLRINLIAIPVITLFVWLYEKFL